MKHYIATCYDEGSCEYAQVDTYANDWTHALQRIAAGMPDEEPDHVLIHILHEGDRNGQG